MQKMSRLFTKTLKEAPADETAVNARFLIRGGFISKIMAGVYVYLPLGLRVLENINRIIREEMNATGAQELELSVIQKKETWTATGRWDSAKEVMYQFEDVSGKEVGLGWTHEEPLTEIARHFIQSYRDLPKAVYQIQVKFRNEPRAKSGILRGREFLMKDLYSFHASNEDLDAYYERVAQAYENIFKRIGLPARRTLASGGLFSKFSDEYQVLAEVGEDTIFYCMACAYTANKEVAEDLNLSEVCPECKGKLTQGQSIEAGNIFKLGTKFSEAFGLEFSDEKGIKNPVIMASYGIGPGRAMGTIVELNYDQNGIIWPDSVAPYAAHVVVLDGKNTEAETLSRELEEADIEVLLDDREDKTPGEKFADADLIGIPWRMVVSKRTLEKNSAEVKRRDSKESKIMLFSEVVVKIKDAK